MGNKVYAQGWLNPTPLGAQTIMTIQHKGLLQHLHVRYHNPVPAAEFEASWCLLIRAAAILRVWPIQAQWTFGAQPTPPAGMLYWGSESHNPLIDIDDNLAVFPGDLIQIQVVQAGGANTTVTATVLIEEYDETIPVLPKFPGDRWHMLAAAYSLDNVEGGDDDYSKPWDT